ncbi:MAG: rane dipeptidase [Frankiaceae bacterium]|jgi:membrane dipeptidase|nr:rane dipeptidase [Frankiaceae bacterium]
MTKKRYDGYESYAYLEPGVDYRRFDLVDQLGRVAPYDLGLTSDEEERADRLLADSVVVSLHEHVSVYPSDIAETPAYNRTLRQVTGYEGLAQSGMDAVFENFMDGIGCITSNAGWKWDDIVYDVGMRLSDLAHQDFVVHAGSVAEILDARESGRLALIPGLEAATPIENELDRIDVLYGLGIRQLGIAYSDSNTLGTGLKERRDGGLTEFGRAAVRRMNRLGIVIDVSHSSDQTCLDTFEASEAPVLITHAGARGVWDTKRMKPDGVLLACAAGGGLIGIEAAPHTTISHDHPAHSIESVMDHFEYCVDLLGIEHVAFGPDTLFGDHVALHRHYAEQISWGVALGGPTFEPVEYVAGLENPAECFPNIVRWLVKHGYADDDIRAVVGGNALRVLREIWGG